MVMGEALVGQQFRLGIASVALAGYFLQTRCDLSKTQLAIICFRRHDGMKFHLLAAVACGGAIGATGRYVTSFAISSLITTGFPIATLVVNVIGSFILGMLVEAFALFWSPGLTVQAFLTFGVLGGFTTFSAFSVDTMLLLHRGEPFAALVYVLTSVVMSLAAAYLGFITIRAFA